ncbi:MAG: integrin alpha [Planctomycetota bacterium]
MAVGLAASPAWAQGGYPEFPADASLLRGDSGFVMTTLPRDSRLGRSIAAAGDINNDGIDDFAVTAFDGRDASVYVIFGRADGGFGDELDVWALDGSNGFRIREGPALERFARFARTIGDINHDGVDDLFVSGIARAWPDVAFVVFGRADGSFPALFEPQDLGPGEGLFLQVSPDRGRMRGDASVNGAGLGDFNGDGVDDLAIGTGALPIPNGNTGKAYVLYGSADGFPESINLEELDGVDGFVMIPEEAQDLFGLSMAGAGDVNGDGLGDIVIGGPGRNAIIGMRIPTAGKAHVVFGTDSPPAELLLGELDGTNGFTLRPERDEDFALGYGVWGVGDVNGDGRDDVAIGAPEAGPEFQGEVYVVYGRGSFEAEYLTDELTESDALVITGRTGPDADDASLGWSIGFGDPNGDGIPDVLIGDPTQYSFLQSNGVHVLFGRADGGPLVPGGVLAIEDLDGRLGFTIEWSAGAQSFFGGSVGGLGDINADGVGDIGIGANLSDQSAGRAFVHFGGGLCTIDLNGDRTADLFDILTFLDLFEARDPIADWDGDGSRTAMDLQAYLNDFDAGCP